MQRRRAALEYFAGLVDGVPMPARATARVLLAPERVLELRADLELAVRVPVHRHVRIITIM